MGVGGGDLTPMLRQKQAILRLKLKKVRKTTRTFSYDLNQIPYAYIMEMKIRHGIRSGSLKNYGRRFVTLYGRQSPKPSPRKTNMRRKSGCMRRS